jgi:hypothetical protein
MAQAGYKPNSGSLASQMQGAGFKPVSSAPSPTTNTGILATIKNAAAAGISKIKSGFAEVQQPMNSPADIAKPVEAGLKIGAGTVETAASPLAPLFSPVGKLIGYVSDKLSDNPTVQRFAMSGAGGAVSRVAEDVGNATEIAGAVVGSRGSAPVEAALDKAATKVADTTGSVAAQGLGATTGTGAASVRTAFTGSQAFVDAMRGKVVPEQVIESAQNAVQNIVENRRQTYLADLSKVGANTRSLDISPIQATLGDKLKAFGIKVTDNGELDFSRSSIANNGTARADVQGVYDTLKSWGSQKGDRTPIGLDTLKKQLADFYSPSGSARALVTAVKSKVSDILNNQVSGYKELTSKYTSASQLLDDIKSATSIGGRAKADTIFTKLTTALKGDKEFRLEMLEEMQSKGAQPQLMEHIAGINMSSAIPKGLVGKGADIGAAFAVLGHFFNPHYIPMLLATSPRVVGEFVHALGYSRNAASAIIGALNKVAGKTITGSAAAAPQASQAPARPPTTP